jgi:aminopeptidase-like protein
MSGQMNSGRRNTTAARDLEEAISRVDSENLGQEMMDLMARLFPICRSLTGDGVRETLNILSDTLPLKIDQVPTGYQAFDWNVPREWNIRDAYVKDSSGERIIDFRKSNLHILNYRVPFSGTLTREELLPHLHAKPELPEAIPYMTSY